MNLFLSSSNQKIIPPVFFTLERSFSLVDFFAKKWNTVRLIGNPLFIIMKKRGNTIEDKENNNSMDRLNLSDNIIRLRRERRITQEELADFLGVSKAAVSKWENAQSTPDLMLLLELSAYFGTTIDELIGYKAKLSKDQIRRFYAELVKDFARLPYGQRRLYSTEMNILTA